MRIRKILFLSPLLLGVLILTSTEAAAEGTWNFNFTESTHGGLGIDSNVSYLAGMQNTQVKNASTGQNIPAYYLCKDFSDVNCSSSENWSSYSLLPPCSISQDSDCIESLATSEDGTVFTNAIFKSLSSEKVFDANLDLGVPEGSSISYWEAVDGSGKSVKLGARVMEAYSGKRSVEIFPTDLIARISQFRTESLQSPDGIYRVFQALTPSGTPQINGSGGNPKCIFYLENLCAQTEPFTVKYLKMDLIVSKKLSGWMRGRLTDSLIKISSLDEKRNRVSVTGSPVSIPLVNKTVDRVKLPDSMKNMGSGIDGVIPGGASGITLQTSQTGTMGTFTQIMSLLGEYATSVEEIWSFRTVGQAMSSNSIETDKCFQKSDGFLGLVSTNSTTYEMNPPTFDGTSLNYSVAALHFTPDGKEFKGSYNLSLRSEIGRCLYGFNSAPLKAEISVTSDNGATQVATTSFGEKDGWLRFSANGFTFSNPSIKLKLSQQAVDPVNQRVNPKKTMKPKATKRILCVKGKMQKSLENREGCPKGYRIKN